MRKMKLINSKEGNELNIVGHIMLKNFWEYYIIQDDSLDNQDQDIFFALVMGFETELGYVSMNEIKPYIVSKTSHLTDLMPCIGYEWVD